MKKRISILLALILVLTMLIPALSTVSFAEEGTTGETNTSETITISYMNGQDTTSTTTSLDTTAYSGGKQTVGKGEKFTLPTTSNATSATEDGYQLVWYTRDGRTYKAGEEVSFEEDTSLYRVAAKECYTAAELGTALTSGTKAGILMADMETTSAVSFPSWSTGIIIMNGFNLNFVSNSSGLIGEQRTQRHFYGEGTINVTNPDGKVGEYYFLKATNHGYAGDNSRTVIGRDVTINAPNHYLTGDGSSDVVTRYVWTKIYGTINCYGLFYRPAANNCGAFTEFFDTCNVTFTGEHLIWDANSNGKFNYLGTDIAIYGGTFNLPAAAANESFWTNDNLETITNHDGTKTYTNVGLTQLNKDNIKIYGGSFVTADGSMPAIADYIANTYTGAWRTGGNGLTSNNNTSTYEIPYKVRPGIKLVFTTYSDSALGTITVTDYVGSALAGKTFKYRVNTITDENSVTTYEIVVYESRIETTTAEDGTVTETEVWDVVSDELAIKWGNGGTILVSYDLTRENLELYGFEANNAVYQTVVPADCEHNFTGAPVDATCESKAYADYNCSVCSHNVYFSWGEKLGHTYEATSSVAPTASTLGSSSFVCSACGEAKTYATTLDPRELEVAVKIKNDDGTFENVTALASDVFEFSTIGANGAYMYTLTAIKAFGEYNIRNINAIVIPNGIMYVNIATQNLESYNGTDQGLETLEIAENSTITLQNIGNLSCLTTLKVGKNANIVIEANASTYSPNGENRTNSKLATVDFSAGNITAKVMSSAFYNRPITSLLLGKDSSYEFQWQSFRNIQITELVIPTPITLICGSNAFRDADLTSLTFPDGTVESTNTFSFADECFRYCPITSVKFGQYGTYSIGNTSFGNLKLTGALTFAPNSTYTVSSWAFSNNQFTVIDASAGNITLNVNGSGLRDLTNVTEFKFGENSKYTFNGESIGKTTYTKFTLAPNSTYIFNDNFLRDNTTFTEIDASADNITISFNARCFNGRTAFNKITFGKNATLTFSEDCFKSTALEGLTLCEGSTITINGYSMRNFAITELVLPENANVTFSSNAFNGSNIETLTLSKNSSFTFNNASFHYTTKFTELVIPENSTCLFKDWALNTGSTITKLDLSANGINATFNSHALRNAKALTELVISGKNGTYIFNGESVRDASNIKELALGEGSTYTFAQNSFYGVSLTSFDASADNVTATFGREVFSGDPITTLEFGKNSNYTIDYRAFYNTTATNDIVFYANSTYSFGQEAFANADFNSIKFEDNVNVTFAGQKAFQYVSAKSLYLGKNFQIDNLPFCDMKYVEKIVIMDGVNFKDNQAEQWTFSAAGDADFSTPLVVYNHSYDLLFAQNMFNNCDGIVLYTVTDNIGTRNDVFSNCTDVKDADGNLLYKAWTVHLGIPHPMVEGHISDPTCDETGVTGWVCDTNYCNCDFKIVETTVVNKYENVHNINDTTVPVDTTTYEVVVAPAWGHDYGVESPVRIGWIYVDNNYFANAKNEHNCTVCGENYLGKDIENSALFTAKGITLPEDVVDAIAHAITVNLSAVEAYNAFIGAENAIKYGVVAGIASEDGKPVTSEGKTTGKAVCASFEKTSFSILQLKITNITDTAQGLYCCAYVIADGEVTYLHNGVASDTATAVSLDEPNGIEEEVVENVQVEAVVETKEIVYA